MPKKLSYEELMKGDRRGEIQEEEEENVVC
jgi:hypothetical protein